MGVNKKYIMPIIESRMQWKTVVEKVRNQMNAFNSNTIRSVQKSVASSLSGEFPNRRIGREDFMPMLTANGATLD